MTQTVEFEWTEKQGSYLISATVYANGVVKIEHIETDDGEPCDIMDWTPNEQFAMRNLARKTAAANDEQEDDDADDEADIQGEEGNWR